MRRHTNGERIGYDAVYAVGGTLTRTGQEKAHPTRIYYYFSYHLRGATHF